MAIPKNPYTTISHVNYEGVFGSKEPVGIKEKRYFLLEVIHERLETKTTIAVSKFNLDLINHSLKVWLGQAEDNNRNILAFAKKIKLEEFLVVDVLAIRKIVFSDKIGFLIEFSIV